MTILINQSFNFFLSKVKTTKRENVQVIKFYEKNILRN